MSSLSLHVVFGTKMFCRCFENVLHCTSQCKSPGGVERGDFDIGGVSQGGKFDHRLSPKGGDIGHL